MMSLKIVATCGCLLLTSVLAGVGIQPDAAVQAPRGSLSVPQITVSGSGEVERKPDYAIVSVGVQVREKNASRASKKVGDAMTKVRDAIEELRIEGLQLQTSGVSLNPAYVWSNEGPEQKQTLVGYDASSILRVRIEDPSKVGEVIDAAVDAGANRIHGISFELKGALEARQEALRMAANAAREKAETLADALDLRIVSVVTATTSSNEAPPWQPMAMANEARFDAGGGMGRAIEPGMVTVRAEATVTFAARPKREN